jgi:superfamily II DNA/RNA helicase
MGMDIPDVARVVGFMIPTSLSVWVQRYGRVGRNGEPGEAILLVEPSVYQLKKENRTQENGQDDADEAKDGDNAPTESETHRADTRYVKKVEAGLRKWIEASCEECRRLIETKYFDCPDGGKLLSVPCCDLCVLKKAREHPDDLSPQEQKILDLIQRLKTRIPPTLDPQADTDVQMNKDDSSNAAIKNAGDISLGDAEKENQRTGMKKRPCGIGDRRAERLETCRKALADWREQVWNRDFLDCTFGVEAILPDMILTKLATHARLQTLQDIKNDTPDWVWMDEYGDEVLQLLAPIDKAYHEENEKQKTEARAKKAKVTVEKRIACETTAQRNVLAPTTVQPMVPAYLYFPAVQPMVPVYPTYPTSPTYPTYPTYAYAPGPGAPTTQPHYPALPLNVAPSMRNHQAFYHPQYHLFYNAGHSM